MKITKERMKEIVKVAGAMAIALIVVCLMLGEVEPDLKIVEGGVLLLLVERLLTDGK